MFFNICICRSILIYTLFSELLLGIVKADFSMTYNISIDTSAFYGISDSEGLAANLIVISKFWDDIVLQKGKKLILVPFKSEHWGYFVSYCDIFILPDNVECSTLLPDQIIKEKVCHAERPLVVLKYNLW